MSTQDVGEKKGKDIVKDVSTEKADKLLEDGPEWICTVHLKLRVPCDKTCGFLDNWEKDHEKCPKRVHKTEIVYGRIFGNKDGWVVKK